jgi:hypothetical protein
MIINYLCKNCEWTGSENEIEYETIEGCFGDDKLEICPRCGSEKVFVVFSK